MGNAGRLNRSLLGSVTTLSLLVSQLETAWACKKDRDCQGDLICEEGQCVPLGGAPGKTGEVTTPGEKREAPKPADEGYQTGDASSAQDTLDPAAPSAESGSDTGEREAKNALHLELLGLALLYSLNYERWFANDFSSRVGFSYFSLEPSSAAKVTLMMVPLTVSYLGIGSPNNMLELGAGAVFAHASALVNNDVFKSEDAASTVWGTAIVGYRHQPEDGGFMFRVGASPLIGEGGVLVWPHLSLGGAF